MRKTKAANNAYMRAYRKAKPQKKLMPEGRDMREAWALGLEDLASRGTPIYVRFDGHQLTADFPGAFAHALVVLSGYREIVPDTGLEWMYDLLVIGVFGPGETVKLTLGQANGRGANYSKGSYQTRPHGAKVAAKLGLVPKEPPPPLPSIDELRKLTLGGIVITEEDWARAKEIHDIARTQPRRREGIPATKSQVSAYFDNEKFSLEKRLDWANLKQQQTPYGRRILPKKTGG